MLWDTTSVVVKYGAFTTAARGARRAARQPAARGRAAGRSRGAWRAGAPALGENLMCARAAHSSAASAQARAA